MLTVFLLLAQEAAKPPEPGWFQLVMWLPLLVLAYFFLIRPMTRQEQERKQLRASLKKDDKIITTSGIYGTVVSISDKEDEIVVKLADNVRIRMIKAAIDRNLSNEEAAREAKAKGGKAAASTGITNRPGE
jgi:preprotein translocase subunit YajC